VPNHAKLAYDCIAPWLEGSADMPLEIAAVNGLAENLRLQDHAAQTIKNHRHMKGALYLETLELKPIFEGDSYSRPAVDEKNRAKDIIEDFMIAANGGPFGISPQKNFHRFVVC
jgi:exoribonuclease R